MVIFEFMYREKPIEKQFIRLYNKSTNVKRG